MSYSDTLPTAATYPTRSSWVLSSWSSVHFTKKMTRNPQRIFMGNILKRLSWRTKKEMGGNIIMDLWEIG
jgi:hypothetical protein